MDADFINQRLGGVSEITAYASRYAFISQPGVVIKIRCLIFIRYSIFLENLFT